MVGYHFIPAEHHTRRLGKGGVVDPHLGLRFGEWLVVGTLGSGGIGSVYLALQDRTGIKGALKLLTTTRPELIRKFEDEAKALVQLDSPHVVRVYGFDVSGPRPYLVMEFIDGGRTLHDALKAGLSVGDALGLLQQVVRGLTAAHARGIVHRDIKPDNIMLQRLATGEDFVRLVDFGLAKSLESGEHTSIVAGTPAYMAPEQFRKETIGPWTDWYAVGALVFLVLNGFRPFRDLSESMLIAAKLSPTVDPIRAIEGRQRPEVVAFLRHAMAFEPAQRIRDGATFLRELTAAFQHAGQGAAVGQTASLGGTRILTLVSSEVETDGSVPSVDSADVREVPSVALPATAPAPKRLAVWALLALLPAALVGWVVVRAVMPEPESPRIAPFTQDASPPTLAVTTATAPATQAPDAAQPDAARPVVVDAAVPDAALVDAARPVKITRRTDRKVQPIKAVAAPETVAPMTAPPTVPGAIW